MEKAVSQILCFFIYGNLDSFDVNAPQRRLDVPAVPSKHELIVSIRPLTSGLDHTVSRLQMSSEVQTHTDEPLGASICVQIFFADWRFDLGEILTYKFQHIRSRFENVSERFERGHRTGHNLVTMCLSSSKAIRCHSTFDRKIPYLVSFFHVFRTLVQLINPVPDCEFIAHVRPIWGIFYDETYVGTSEAYNLGKPMERWQFVIAYCGDFTDPEFRFSIRLLAQTLFSP